MRIFFIQKAHGLFASSGEYRANISFLKHLASLGHATAQVCYYQEGEVESCIKEVEEAGGSADLVKDAVKFDAKDGGSVSVDVSTFTNIDGIRMIAFDAKSFEEVFPSKLYAKETIDYIEVGHIQHYVFIALLFSFCSDECVQLSFVTNLCQLTANVPAERFAQLKVA
jgi:hypothetical protein